MHVHNEDRILDFLDGRLNSGAEEDLLHTLAVSPERRQLLREHLKLRELTSTISRQDRFAVPEHVTTSLFNKLTDLGFTAPVSTSAILNNAPELIRSSARFAETSAQLAKTATETEDRIAVLTSAAVGAAGFFARMRSSMIVTACAVSFFLGIGAFYVFGSMLGIRTMSERESHTGSSNLAARHGGSSSVHDPFSASVLQPFASVTPSTPSGSSIATGSLSSGSVASRGSYSGSIVKASIVDIPEGLHFGNRSSAHLGSVATPELAETVPPAAEIPSEPIPLTSPKLPPRLDLGKLGRSSSFLLNSPYGNENQGILSERGTISFRFGSGRAPKNTTASWSSLSELKFSWTILDYIVARASLGQFVTYERQAVIDPSFTTITTSPAQKVISVAGAELGVTLDPLNIPIEIAGGLLVDGSGHPYSRGGVYGHFELFDAVSVGVGIEGVIYKNDVNRSITNVSNIYRGWKPTVASSTDKETAGFVGPSIEFGWHF